MNSPSRSPILQLHDLNVTYPGEPPLARGWCASIGPGVTLLHGDTGSGKSTLLRVMAGRLPARGHLTLAGLNLHENAEAYRRQVFFLEAGAEAFDQVVARECRVAANAVAGRFSESTWQHLVEGFTLSAHLDKPMYMLSTGSKRKVWLAAALASGAALTLLDEPTSGLDAASIGCLWRALARIGEQPDRAMVIASAERIDRVPLAATIELPLGGPHA